MLYEIDPLCWCDIMPKRNYTYIIPKDIVRNPEKHEITATKILANYFKVNIVFVKKNNNIKTTDIDINGRIWEMKSPTGCGKHTVQHQFNRARKQSSFIILCSRRTKISDSSFKKQCLKHFKESSYFKGLIIISKTGEIILELYK